MAENDNFKVTPWDVEGNVDYRKLLEKFGTDKIDTELRRKIKKAAGEEHMYLRRGYFFSHRDMGKIIEDHQDGKGFFLYTGIGPSGSMHIGHLTSFYLSKWLQEKFDVNLYIQVTDDEKYWTRDITFDKIEEYTDRNIRNVAAVEFDPDKTFIFRDREYMGHMYDAAIKIAKKINNSVARATFGFDSSTNIGKNFWPAIQLLPTFLEEKRCLIPSAIDQDPYWRVQRDVAESLGYYKTAAIHSKFLPALTGPDKKMSSSQPKTTIMLDDSPEEVREKIMRHAYSGGRSTKKKHREEGADLSVDVSYRWLHDLLLEDDERISEIAEKYGNGEMLTGEVKQIMVEKLNEFLTDHRRRREEKGRELKEKMMYEGDLAKEMWNRKIELD